MDCPTSLLWKGFTWLQLHCLEKNMLASGYSRHLIHSFYFQKFFLMFQNWFSALFWFVFIAIEWIRITYLCCWKRPLNQHSHNHCSIISFIVTLPSYCHFPGLFTWNVIRKCLPRANTKGIFLIRNLPIPDTLSPKRFWVLISLSFLYLPLSPLLFSLSVTHFSFVSTSCVFCSSHLRNATWQARKSEINDH